MRGGEGRRNKRNATRINNNNPAPNAMPGRTVGLLGAGLLGAGVEAKSVALHCTALHW